MLRAGQYQVIAPAYPPTSAMVDLVGGVAAVLDAEQVSTVHLVGSSFGGYLAQCLVHAHPAAFQVLAGAGHGPLFTHTDQYIDRLLAFLADPPAFVAATPAGSDSECRRARWRFAVRPGGHHRAATWRGLRVAFRRPGRRQRGRLGLLVRPSGDRGQCTQHVPEFPAAWIHLRGFVRQAERDIADTMRLQQGSKPVVDSLPDLHAVGPGLMIETDAEDIYCCL
jgi:pimeloyl-ACP methyl ester carboxylesterase